MKSSYILAFGLGLGLGLAGAALAGVLVRRRSARAGSEASARQEGADDGPVLEHVRRVRGEPVGSAEEEDRRVSH